MITLKQIEAFTWIAKLGSFERAATRLNTTQSAISKRIQDLETSTGLPLLDRSHRSARLTEYGEQLLALGGEMLDLQQRILGLRDVEQPLARRLRLGVTEMSAISWLPRMVTAIQEAHPLLSIEPEVDMSRNLYDRLLNETIDLIIIPNAFSDPEVSSVHLANVSNVWTARPGAVRSSPELDCQELTDHTILTQSGRSGSSLLINKWLRANGIVFKREIVCDSLTALIGLVAAGVGVSYLPRHCFQSLLDEKRIAILPVQPPLPTVSYSAMYRSDRPSTFLVSIAELARTVCNFVDERPRLHDPSE